MKSMSSILRTSTFRKIVPVLFFSCATLVGCLNNNVHVESTKPKKEETTYNHDFAKL